MTSTEIAVVTTAIHSPAAGAFICLNNSGKGNRALNVCNQDAPTSYASVVSVNSISVSAHGNQITRNGHPIGLMTVNAQNLTATNASLLESIMLQAQICNTIRSHTILQFHLLPFSDPASERSSSRYDPYPAGPHLMWYFFLRYLILTK